MSISLPYNLEEISYFYFLIIVHLPGTSGLFPFAFLELFVKAGMFLGLEDIQLYFVNYLLLAFASFSIKVFVFLLLTYRCLLYITDTVPLPCTNISCFPYHAQFIISTFPVVFIT